MNKWRITSPTKTTVVIAMHLWPEEPKQAPTKALIVSSLSASGKTTAWFLAPMLLWTLFPLAVPVLYMYSPPWFDPTNDIALISGCVHIFVTVSLPPWTKLKTPFGNPISKIFKFINFLKFKIY